MEIGRIEYEGRIHGIGEWQYSKVSKLLKSALPLVEYEYLDDGTGAVNLGGSSEMFEEDMENLSATFDLLADQVGPDCGGVILAKKWSRDGGLELTAYEFKNKSFNQRSLLPED
ncbi:hypothetical protein [Desulfocurvus sp. DL9XJH121]